jgi:hypothetical protein
MLRLTLTLAAVVFVFASCRQRNDSSSQHLITSSLEAANKTILEYNVNLLNQLESKSKDLRTVYRAAIWRPKADSVHKFSSRIFTYIEGLKSQLHQKQGNKDLFLGNARTLYRQLVNYKLEILDALDSETFVDNPRYREQMRKDSVMFVNHLPLFVNTNLDPVNEEAWLNSTFKDANLITSLTILHAIANNIIVSENQLLNYFNYNCVVNFCGFDQFTAIANLSSSYVKQGDSIIVTAGLGSFVPDPKPKIIIDGKVMGINSEGIAAYTFRVDKKPGTHFVRVQMEVKTPRGNTIPVYKDCYYKVVQ